MHICYNLYLFSRVICRHFRTVYLYNSLHLLLSRRASPAPLRDPPLYSYFPSRNIPRAVQNPWSTLPVRCWHDAAVYLKSHATPGRTACQTTRRHPLHWAGASEDRDAEGAICGATFSAVHELLEGGKKDHDRVRTPGARASTVADEPLRPDTAAARGRSRSRAVQPSGILTDTALVAQWEHSGNAGI